MTHQIFMDIITKQMWTQLFCISFAFLLGWYFMLKLGFMILNVKFGIRKIFPLILIGSLYSFWARQALSMQLVGILMPVLIAFLLWIPVRGLPLLKYCWASFICLLISLCGNIILGPLISTSLRFSSFLLNTSWGVFFGIVIETAFVILALLLLPKILPKHKIPWIPSVGLKPERVDFYMLLTYFGMYLMVYLASIIFYIAIRNGSQLTILFLLFQWSTTATTLIGHYRIVKKLESEKVNLIGEKARLEEDKVGLEADKAQLAAEKAKLEADKADLLKKLRKFAGANHLEVAIKSQQLDEIFNDFIGRVYNIYNPSVLVDPANEPAPAAGLVGKISIQSQYKLTSREILILKGIVAGKENKEIGADIYLVEGTVKNHVTKLFRKFGVQNREELARFVTENGLIERN